MSLTRKGRKSLSDLLQRAKAEAADKPRRLDRSSPPPLTFQTVALTPSAKELLARLTVQVAERTGRRVSASSVVRALIQVAERGHLTAQVAHIIETELNTGAVVWGRVRKGR